MAFILSRIKTTFCELLDFLVHQLRVGTLNVVAPSDYKYQNSLTDACLATPSFRRGIASRSVSIIPLATLAGMPQQIGVILFVKRMPNPSDSPHLTVLRCNEIPIGKMAPRSTQSPSISPSASSNRRSMGIQQFIFIGIKS